MTVIAANLVLHFSDPTATNHDIIYALNAEIPKSFLEDIDLEKLKDQYPNRIVVNNNRVKLTGPLVIVPKIRQIPGVKLKSIALAFLAFGVFSILNATFNLSLSNINRNVQFELGLTYTKISGLVSVIFAVEKALDNYVTDLKDPGIYFYNYSSKIPFFCPATPLEPSIVPPNEQ